MRMGEAVMSQSGPPRGRKANAETSARVSVADTDGGFLREDTRLL